MLKKFFLILVLIFSNLLFIGTVWAEPSAWLWNQEIKNALLNVSSDNIVESSDNDGISALNSLFIWAKDSLTWLLILISIWVFLFVWVRLAFAKWNPEEFKKAMLQLVYAVIWIFVVSAAWAAVKLVSWINI